MPTITRSHTSTSSWVEMHLWMRRLTRVGRIWTTCRRLWVWSISWIRTLRGARGRLALSWRTRIAKWTGPKQLSRLKARRKNNRFQHWLRRYWRTTRIKRINRDSPISYRTQLPGRVNTLLRGPKLKNLLLGLRDRQTASRLRKITKEKALGIPCWARVVPKI